MKGNKEGDSKTYRMLNLYERLNKGDSKSKKDLSELYSVDEKTIQRDIKELKNYLEEDKKKPRTIIYNKNTKKYEMINCEGFKFADKDIFTLSKIILESRAFSKQEMDRILNILNSQCEDNGLLKKIISNERFNYVPPKHNKNIIDFIWEISISIQKQKKVQVKYERQDGKIKEYILKPLGLVFSEFYFYLVGEIEGKNENHSIVFRVDRFEKYNIMQGEKSTFSMPYKDRFEEGEFHKRIQFMYTGELIKIQFKFWGHSLEAILDRLPTSKVIGYDEKDNKPIIEAEVYGEGVKRWLLSQKECLEVIRPEEYREEIKETIRKMYEIYK
ncbi:helix-turn-helix transcriptional regulator [Clostridium uliginosum]|uniref:Predicted DNA-binding transcriptional regulator YafY, contains an HTH and WYL domains n=1 Tax=Clostridium uliginosum TaxID=119641 RepID=A0A1I1NQ56_9CLOT|nr:WYL domain-containing protein [Clostridium uliginosum]SFC99801.1 Predicted DNA-binding transcriptional regulator YafY, contains an HTH and WYL domains [Clostridium uliginosum]